MEYTRIFRFKSKYRNQTCTIKPSQNARESESGIPVAGIRVQFSEHYYETDNPEIAERLKFRARNPIPGSRITYLGEIYQCPEPGCGDTFENIVALEEHLQQEHGRQVGDADERPQDENESISLEQCYDAERDRYVCPEPGCQAEFDTGQKLNGHLTKHRKEAKV